MSREKHLQSRPCFSGMHYLVDNLRDDESLPSQLDGHVPRYVRNHEREKQHDDQNQILPNNEPPNQILAIPIQLLSREEDLSTAHHSTAQKSTRTTEVHTHDRGLHA